MRPAIEEFNGKYFFLSNFWSCKVMLDGLEYPSVEHAYQAAKTLDKNKREQIRCASTPGAAKKLGQKVDLRADWEKEKLSVMEELLRQKFSTDLRDKLVSTGDSELVEGNWWGDCYWGRCKGRGENHLGKLLMKIRGEGQGATV